MILSETCQESKSFFFFCFENFKVNLQVDLLEHAGYFPKLTSYFLKPAQDMQSIYISYLNNVIFFRIYDSKT